MKTSRKEGPLVRQQANGVKYEIKKCKRQAERYSPGAANASTDMDTVQVKRGYAEGQSISTKTHRHIFSFLSSSSILQQKLTQHSFSRPPPLPAALLPSSPSYLHSHQPTLLLSLVDPPKMPRIDHHSTNATRMASGGFWLPQRGSWTRS